MKLNRKQRNKEVVAANVPNGGVFCDLVDVIDELWARRRRPGTDGGPLVHTVQSGV